MIGGYIMLGLIVLAAASAWYANLMWRKENAARTDAENSLMDLRRDYQDLFLLRDRDKSQQKYHELPGIDQHLYQQFLLGLVKNDGWTYLLDTYLHQFTSRCGEFAENGSVNSELLNSGKIQAVRGLAEYVDTCVSQIRVQQAMEQHESATNE